MAPKRKIEQTAAPLRNFTMTTSERVNAIVTGLPAWARRLKRIEDLGPLIVEAHRAGRALDAKKKLKELVELVAAHNAYYPIEANLPLDPETSRLMDNGEPWRPMPRPTLDSLIATLDARDEEPPASIALAWADRDGALSVSFDCDDERYTLRLDDEALTCSTRAGEIARVPTFEVEEIAAREHFEVITNGAQTIRFPFRLDAATLRRVTDEMSARLRTLRTARSIYR